MVARGRFVNQRLAPVPMETNGIAVLPEGDSFTVWVSTQVPFDIRNDLAEALGVDKDQVRVIAPDVGGGFGAKLEIYVEYLAVGKAAQLLGRPVRWFESRSESMLSLTHGRVRSRPSRSARSATARSRGCGSSCSRTWARILAPPICRRSPTRCSPASTRPADRLPRTDRRHERHPDGALPRRRQDPRRPLWSSGPWTSGGRARHGSGRAPSQELHPVRRLPLHDLRRNGHDIGDYPQAVDEAMRLAGYDAPCRTGGAPRSAAITWPWGSA